jgi:GDP-4-dehydro-6-deoxy-D-mannose reductase
MLRLLITGGSGFVGMRLQKRAATLAGVVLVLPPPADLRDADATAHSLDGLEFDAVMHLAAASSVAAAEAAEAAATAVNVAGTRNLLAALEARRFAGRLLYASSGEVYGVVAPEQLPIEERMEPQPRSVYARSKLAAEALCLAHHERTGQDIVIARAFNHTGAGQSERFVIPALARQVVRIARSLDPPVLTTGDLDVTRDFSHVDDVIDAYFALLRTGKPATPYNVASGRETVLREVLTELAALAGIEVPEVRVDPTRVRPGEQRRVRASHAKLTADTGWSPRRELRTALVELLNYWGERECR